MFEHLFEHPAGTTSTPVPAGLARSGVEGVDEAGDSPGSEARVVRYDDPVEVRTGRSGPEGLQAQEGPAQFLWRGRLWKVREVLERRSQELPRRELWRVAAGRGRLDQPASAADGGSGGDVFELAHDLHEGRWQLVAVAGRAGE